MIKVSHNLEALNRTLTEYRRVSGLTTTEVLVKQGTKLSFELSNRLKGLMPGRGAIRNERLAALKSGEGVHVRPSIARAVLAKQGAAVSLKDKAQYLAGQQKTERQIGTLAGVRFKFGKKTPDGVKEHVKRDGTRLNLQALMVQRELNAREGGRGYLGVGARMKIANIAATKLEKFFGRYRQQLSSAGLGITPDNQSLTFTYGGTNTPDGPVDIGSALQKPRQQNAISQALGAVRADMAVYLQRKQVEALQASLKTALRVPEVVT